MESMFDEWINSEIDWLVAVSVDGDSDCWQWMEYTDSGDHCSGEEEGLAETPVGLGRKVAGHGHTAVGSTHDVQQQFIQFLFWKSSIITIIITLFFF